MKLRGRLSRLPLKKVPWPQGAWPLGGTRSVRRHRGKSRAAKKSLAREKLPERSLLWLVATTFLLQHVKTPHCSQLQRVGTHRTKLFTTQGLPWPQQAAVPSPPSYAASCGPASSSQTCLPTTTAPSTLQSSSSSMSWASKLPTEMRRSWRTGFPWRSRTGPEPGSRHDLLLGRDAHPLHRQLPRYSRPPTCRG